MITPEESLQMSQMMNYMERAEIFPKFAAASISTIMLNGMPGYAIEFAQSKQGNDLDTVMGVGNTLTEAMIAISSKIRAI